MPGQITPCHQPPKNICILRLSAIGDVCHAVAMVQQIQKFWPKTAITWVIGKIEASLLEGLPGVEFVIFDKAKGICEYSRLRSHFRRQLSGTKFDILLHMQTAIRASLVSFCIPAKKKIGFDWARAREAQWLFVKYKISPQNQPHVVDGFLAFARAIGVPEEKPTWNMPIEDGSRRWVQQNLPDAYCVICPSASKAERNWMVERYVELVLYVVEKGVAVALCGGPAAHEVELAKQIQALVENTTNNKNAGICNLVGQTSLKLLLAVLEQAQFVVSPDTGPAHMAVTVNTPVIGLYAHSNPARTGPYSSLPFVVSVYDEVIQQQCGQAVHQLPWGTRAKGENLMEKITVTAVKEKVDLVLEASRISAEG